MITQDKLNDFLINSGIGTTPALPDDAYSLPSEDWITGEFASGLGSLLSQLGFAWQKEKQDCDDFALFAHGYASLLHSKMGNKTGLAFGEFWYTRSDLNGGSAHAINVFVIRDPSGNLTLRFFEPQTQKLVTLTPEEINSCEFFRL